MLHTFFLETGFGASSNDHTMMTRKYLWLVLCSALLLVACQKPTILSITSKGNFSFEPEGGKGSFTFVCNKDWRITSNSWIHVSPSSGSGADGDISISFTCDANNTYDSRSGAISIDAEECRTSAIVEQSAESTIIVSPTSFELTSDEQKFEISVQTNLMQWAVWIEASNTWLSSQEITQTKGLTSYKVVYKTAENKTGNNRRDQIYFGIPSIRKVLAIVSVEQQTAPIPVEALLVDYTSFTMTEGQSTRIVVTIKPNNATDKTLTWSTSDATVATVDDEGRVNALKPGTAIITAAAGGQSVSITVTVVPKTIAVTSISLDKTNLGMLEGESEMLTATVKPDDATDKTVSWSSSNSAVASVDNNGTVTAIKEGSAIITAKAGSKSATCSVTVSPNGAIAIDLGLSVKWASCNLGANKPEEYGDYYAWGETAIKENYNMGTYKWNNGGIQNDQSLTKYCPSNKTSYWKGSGSPDNKSVLEPEDDVAHVMLGGKWRMPTDADWTELRINCTWTWTSQNGVKGRLVTSNKNGNSIFLPVTHSSKGWYWSSSLYAEKPNMAYDVWFDIDDVHRYNSYRSDGLAIRPVTE